MSFSFISDLNESRLFPSRQSAERLSREERIELLYLSLCALRIMSCEEEAEDFAKAYARRTMQYGAPSRWRTGVTDFYVLLHALHEAQEDDDGPRYALPAADIEQWLRSFAHQLDSAAFDRASRRLFMRMDHGLRINETSLRAIRRLVMDWPDLDHYERQLATTRLIQKLYNLAPKIDLFSELRDLAKEERLRLTDVQDADDLAENASSGATSAASVATSVSALGVGFDPEGNWGIYQQNRKKKPVILRR